METAAFELASCETELSAAENIVSGIHDSRSAKQAVKDMDAIKSMLEAAEEYGRYASQYCMMEAQMWVKISKIDNGGELLTKSQKDLVSWLQTKTQAELVEIVKECSRGIRIREVKRRDTFVPRYEKELAEYNRISAKIENEISEYGRTTLSSGRFYEEWSITGRPKPHDIAAFKSRTKDMLITKYGGVGLGDGSGTYIVPSVCNRQETAKAIESRLNSVVRDLKSILAICKETRFAVPRSGIVVITNLLSELGQL